MKNTEMKIKINSLSASKLPTIGRQTEKQAKFYGRSLAFFNSFLNLFTAIFKMISVCLPEDI